MSDPRVDAIRKNTRVGRGSAASIDECYDDAELEDKLDRAAIFTPEEAIKWALEEEGLFHEQGLNAREGNDDDELLKSFEEWSKADKEEK